MAAHRGLVFCSVSCFLVLIAVSVEGTNRKITTFVNPGCDVEECKSGVNGSFANLVYVKAEGKNDVLHYALSTIGGVPAVLVLQTDKTSDELMVNWTRLMSADLEDFAKSVSLNNVIYSYSVIFTRLLEYNDTDDAADLTHYKPNSTAFLIRDFTDFQWMQVSQTDKSDIFTFNSTVWPGSEDMLEDDNGMKNHTPSLSFVFHVYGAESRQTELPHLLYNENITQFDFTLDHFTPNFTNSRFAVEMSIFSKGGTTEPMKIEETQSIDDEYTPGVFTITNVETKPSDQAHGGFLQWKPVCYKNTPRARSVATKVQKYQLADVDNSKSIINRTIAFAFLGPSLYKDDVSSKATNISFGLSSDGMYNSTQYVSWTGAIGYGVPPEDTVSLLVIGVIAAGLGIPVIIIIIGGVYMCIKKRKDNRYRQLQDVSSSYPQVNA